MSVEVRALHHHRVHHMQAKKVAPGTGYLTYYIFEAMRAGTFGSEEIVVKAWSGGGGGAKKFKTTESMNNPYLYGLKAVEGIVRGGPIPPGSWIVGSPGPHKRFKKVVCVLEPQFTPPNGRGGFLIHSQGDEGSDGCIVLPDEVFNKVMDKLKKSGGGHLFVCQAIDGNAFA